MDAQAQLDAFVERYSPKVAEDAHVALAWLTARLPTAMRLVYDNYNALVIAFASSEKVSDVILSIALYPRYVRLFFLRGVDLPDPHGLLEGSGSQVRSVLLDPVSRLETAEVDALIGAALSNAPPLPPAGEGKLVIKSISTKQRPRRRSV